MQPELKASRRNFWLCLAGLLLLAVALFLPANSQFRIFKFFTTFQDAVWGKYLEWTAIRSNLRIILVCLGIWLLIDSIGLWFLYSRRTLLGNILFILYVVPLAGLVVGSFYLLKALF